MKISIQTRITKNDLLVLPFYEGKSPKPTQDEALQNQHHPDFEGKLSEQVMIYQKDKISPRILLIGLGPQDKETTETWRRAGGSLATQLKKSIQNITIIPPKENIEFVAAFAEGLLLKHYQYEEVFTDKKRKLTKIQNLSLIIQDKKIGNALKKQLDEIITTTEAVHAVRDMVNAPSNKMSPSLLAKKAQEIAKKSRHLTCKVYGETRLKKMKMGCLIGVGQGAQEETKFIVLEHKYKSKNKKPIVLVGKGICFDAGGINIKMRELPEMKFDMAGAATILGVFQILSKYKLPLHVIGLAPCAENMLGSKAVKPGDILTAYDGTTIEIKNTDAEGRLVLADAIAYAIKNYKPSSIIDVATLTGAAITALGYDISALVSNNNDLKKALKGAAQAADEKIWELPLDADYKDKIKGQIADLDNYSAEVSAGTIMGGAFLEHFTKQTPWAHIDMGGSAWAKEEKPHIPKGATGRMVRTLWKFLKNS
ncbi:leucyl aminopeptidase [Candidatus Peregrinibacteria bacterium]|jgi:leucyl aminopeptidase|nr:leucyl aminopeptidase [Candidatus Peregrinibacteria bacterium]MBT7484544.1 leucyl aminopeptidase [Candidatus Peregrinibacteria bacterium]MBT7703543.1 leucyl aminopeptidase [Candidatus Peregrinibacteria bacterium]